jgi:hypothetical protein
MTQNFKGDATELKMRAIAEPLLDLTDLALNSFYQDGFDCSPFLLMLYDEKRMPFSERIPRAAFVDFVKEALKNFPVTGTFESYLFVLRSIFGLASEINFIVPDPGKLEIDIAAISNTEFDFIAREFTGGMFTFFDMVDSEGNILTFRGVPGIDTEYELNLLFSEIMPAGITPTIALTFYGYYDFIAYDDDGIYDMVDYFANQLIFREIGG